MANNFKNTSLVTRIAVKEFLNALQMGSKVDRQLDSKFRKKGASIDVRRPIMFAATDGATISSAMDLEERAATVTLDQRKKVNFEVTSQDMTLEVDDMTSRYIRPAMSELAQQVESSIAGVYTAIGNFVGTPGTPPATFLAVGGAAKVLKKLGTPQDTQWCAFFDEDASLALADGLKGVFPSRIATRAIEEAEIGRYSKFMMYENQSLALHTVGALGGSPVINGATQETTYALAGDAWTQTLNVDTWSNSITDIVKAGDVFTIAGVNSVNRKTRQSTGDLQTFTITADASSGASTGPTALTISPPIIITGAYKTCDSSPADGAAITIKTGTAATGYKQNLAFHPNAITLAMAPLDMPTDGATASRESFGNVSIRAVRQYDIVNDKTIFRFDILYGVKAQNPDFAVRVTS